MATPSARAKKLLAAWALRPSRAAASSLKSLYALSGRAMPMTERAEVCIALGEAAELDEDLGAAHALYAAAMGAVDARVDERTYTRAAVRSLANAARLGQRSTLARVARVVERLPAGEITPRLACIGAMARGLERRLRRDWTGARRAFESAMSAAWESRDADAEAMAHHWLARAWAGLGRIARAREHVEAAGEAAARTGSWLLERRVELERILVSLSARLTPEGLAEARRYLAEVRRRGFPRLESLAWSKLARWVLPDLDRARAFLARSEKLLPRKHPERVLVKSLRAALSGTEPDGESPDRRLARELDALTRLARN